MIDRFETPPPFSRHDLTFVLALCALTLAVFWPVLGLALLEWDDALHITDNPLFNPPAIGNIARYWLRPFYGLYVPLPYTLWTLIATVTMHPAAFHAANLLTHLVCVTLVYLILRRIIAPHWPAALGAAMFAVHPLQVETVAWVSAFRDLLATMFVLAAIFVHLRHIQAGPSGPDASHKDKNPDLKVRLGTAAVFTFFLAAILSKPSAVVLPLMLLLLDNRPWKIRIAKMIPLFTLAAACVIWTRIAQPSTLVAPSPLWSRPLVAADATAFYLYKLVWPIHLGFDYGRTPQAILNSGQAYFTWLIPAALAAILLLFRRRICVVAALIFLAGVLPVLGLAPFDFQDKSTVADRYMYLPMLGVAVAIGALAAATKLRAVLVGLMLVFGAWSWNNTWHWRDTTALAEHGRAVNPRSWAARNLLAWMAFDRNDNVLAEKLSRQSLELRADNVDAMINLGRALAMQDRVADAVEPLEKAVRLRPDLADAHASLAAAYGEVGRIADALRECERALKLDPQHPAARIMLPRLRAATQSQP